MNHLLFSFKNQNEGFKYWQNILIESNVNIGFLKL